MNTVKDLIALARAKPGQLSVGSSGNGMERIVAEQGSRVVTNSPEEFVTFVRREQAEIAALVRVTGAKID